MNHFFFEVRSREKLEELRSEGLVSQAFYRNRTVKQHILNGIRGGILTVLRLVVRKPHVETNRVIKSHISI
jgi:hypothetical protein